MPITDTNTQEVLTAIKTLRPVFVPKFLEAMKAPEEKKDAIILSEDVLKTSAGKVFDAMNRSNAPVLNFNDFVQYAASHPEMRQAMGGDLVKGGPQINFGDFTLGETIGKALQKAPQGLNRQEFSDKVAQKQIAFARVYLNCTGKNGDITMGEVNPNRAAATEALRMLFVEQQHITGSYVIHIPNEFLVKHDHDNDNHFNLGELREMLKDMNAHPKDHLVNPNDLPKPPAPAPKGNIIN